MKLGLLVMVAVAVVLPSFSESRFVSKCELRDKLQKLIRLPKKQEERTLATIICELERRSHLDTSLVKVFGKRLTTTSKPTVTTAPSTTGTTTMTTATTIQPTSTDSTTTQLATTTATPTAAATATTAAATATTAAATATTAAATATTTAATATDTTTATPATTNSTISSVNTTLVSNRTGGGSRRKRDTHSRSGEDDSHMEDETSSEEDGGFVKPSSLGLYGLFQLSDKDFCDSGYRQSRNKCRTSCTAFTDDDITDDIACFVNTGYWREIMESASNSCRRVSNFFKGCN